MNDQVRALVDEVGDPVEVEPNGRRVQEEHLEAADEREALRGRLEDEARAALDLDVPNAAGEIVEMVNGK